MRHPLESLIPTGFMPVRPCFGVFHITKLYYLVISGNKKTRPKRLFLQNNATDWSQSAQGRLIGHLRAAGQAGSIRKLSNSELLDAVYRNAQDF
jgi:hypothetical protein